LRQDQSGSPTLFGVAIAGSQNGHDLQSKAIRP